jgi:alkylation response protein AidB-like acyl-CoA dehydrogenase
MNSKQFGVATFQALRHRIADMKMQLELAAGYYAALKLNAQPRAPPRAARQNIGWASMRFVAKTRCSCTASASPTNTLAAITSKLTQLE